MLLLVLSSLLAAPPQPAAPPPRDLTLELHDLLAVPYVNDEVLDETGRWTFFAHPELTAPGPGLNCSGFVVAAAQHLLGRSLSLAEATRDRLSDSGEEAPFGKDWDFGFDLVLNLSEGLPRVALLPSKELPVDGLDGQALRGFPIDDRAAWKQLFPRVREGRVYLASLSRRLGQKLQHHHVALVLKDAAGKVWFYQTLPKGRSHRLELTSPQGYARLQQMFGPGIMLLLLEVQPPP